METDIDKLIERLETNDGGLCRCVDAYKVRGLTQPDCDYCVNKDLRDEAAQALRELRDSHNSALLTIGDWIDIVAELKAENEKLRVGVNEILVERNNLRCDVGLLEAENEKLRAVYEAVKSVPMNPDCDCCGGIAVALAAIDSPTITQVSDNAALVMTQIDIEAILSENKKLRYERDYFRDKWLEGIDDY